MKRLLACLPLFAALALPTAATPPPSARGADLVQRLGQRLPLDTPLRAAPGRPTTLRAAMHGKPLLLALGYYRCPRLCDLVMDGMAEAMAGQRLRPGRDFAAAFVSIDPREGPADAETQRAVLARRHPDAALAQWQLYTATRPAVDRLAAALGYRYAYEPELGQYAHPAALVVIAPDGTIVQYLYGVQYQPEALRLALVQASRGQVGSLLDQLVLLCCAYDPHTGRYSLLIDRLLLAMAGLTVLAMAAWLLALHRRQHRREATP
jgi:protein SCO1/2